MWFTAQGKHFWVLRPFSNHTVVCTWAQGNKLAKSICFPTLWMKAKESLSSRLSKGWSFAVFALDPVKHRLSIAYIFHWYCFTKDRGGGNNPLKRDEMQSGDKYLFETYNFFFRPRLSEGYVWSPVSRVFHTTVVVGRAWLTRAGGQIPLLLNQEHLI